MIVKRRGNVKNIIPFVFLDNCTIYMLFLSYIIQCYALAKND